MELDSAVVTQWPNIIIHNVNSQLSVVGVLGSSRPVVPSSHGNGNGNGNPRPAAVVVVVADAMLTEDSSLTEMHGILGRRRLSVYTQPGHHVARLLCLCERISSSAAGEAIARPLDMRRFFNLLNFKPC